MSSSTECTIVARHANGSLDVVLHGTEEQRVRIGKKKVAPLQKEDKQRLVADARLRVTLSKDGAVTAIEEIVADATREIAEKAEHEKTERQQREQNQQRARTVERAVTTERAGGERVANPYTFLPFAKPAPATRERTPRHRTAPWGDGSEDELLSGSFTVELAVRSPLCVFGDSRKQAAEHQWQRRPRGFRRLSPEEQQAEENRAAHRVVWSARDGDGWPTIPGSSLKGALRSWLEVITSSQRLIDERPVSWREISLEPAYPAKISIKDANDKPVSDLLGTHWDQKDQRLHPSVTVELEPLTQWQPPEPDDVNGFEAAQRALTRHWQVPTGQPLQDGQQVTAADGQTQAWLKAAAAMGSDETPGQASLQVLLARQQPQTVPVDAGIVERWCLAHELHLDSGRRPHRFQRPAAAIVDHDDGDRREEIARPRTDVLADGMLVWYRLDADNKVRWFGRIRNGRWAERFPMLARTPERHGPAAPEQLTVTDLLIGTADEAAATSGGPKADAPQDQADAWAGRVRVSPARWASEDQEPIFEWLTLKALSSPKLQSAGLYLRTDDDRPLTWGRHRTHRPDDAKNVDPTAGEIGGTKAYWHTPPSPNGSFTSRVKVEQQESGDGVEDVKTKQNATVEALTAGDAKFRFDVRFEDLRREELGAVLLACSLQIDVSEAEAERGWKLGIGKPLGMGSVANRVVGLQLTDLTERYADPVTAFAGCREQPEADIERLQQQARQAYLSDVREGFVDTLEAAARLDSVWEHPVAYPNFGSTRTPQGLSKQWPDALEVLEGTYHPDDRRA